MKKLHFKSPKLITMLPATPIKKYYRFEGGKLYLSNSKDGIETCYSKIKK